MRFEEEFEKSNQKFNDMKNTMKNDIGVRTIPMPSILRWMLLRTFLIVSLGAFITSVANAQITVPCSPNNPVIVTGDVNDVTCFGYENGEVDIHVSGGFPPYHYSWSNGATTEDLSGLAPGIYSVDVYDNWQCHGSAWFIIGQPSELQLEIVLTEPACGQPSGCAIMSGGTQPYNLFVFSCGFNDPNTQPTPSIALDANAQPYVTNNGGLVPTEEVLFEPSPNDPQMRCADNIPNGLYLVVLVDANGCVDYEWVHIQGNSGPHINATVIEPLCYGDNNGSIDVEISGGHPPYSCSWAIPSTDPLGQSQEIDPLLVNNCDLNNITAGTYLLLVEDANGCTTTHTFHVGQNDAVELDVVLTYPNCGGQPNACAFWSGGTGEYQIFVFQGPVLSPLPVEPVILVNANGDVSVTDLEPTADILPIPYPNPWTTDTVRCANGVADGHYLVVIIDSNGCYDYEWVHIEGTPGLTVSGTVTEPLCHGDANGSIDVEISGGTAPYSCYWALPLLENSTDPTGDLLPVDPTSVNNCSLENVSAGIYFLFVEDANGCTTTHTFHVGQNDPVNIDVELYYPDCGGQPDGCAFFSGGTGEYHIYIYEGPIVLPAPVEPEIFVDANGNVSVTDLSLTTDIAIPEPLPWYTDSILCAEDLPDGHFLIIIVDSNGCYDYEWFHVEGTPGLSIDATITEPLCHGHANGSIDVEISGGTAPYSCYWALPLLENSTDPTGDLLPVDPTSVNNCSLENVSAGIYFLFVEDANGCTTTHTFHVTQPTELELEIVIEYPLCGGQPDGCAFMSGGTAPYNLYVFSDPVIDPIILPEPTVSLDASGNATVDGLSLANEVDFLPDPTNGSVRCASNIPDGLYLVLLVDANGCYTYEYVEIQGTEGLSLNLDFDQYGAYACVNPEGGTAPYFVTWTDLSENIQFPAISQNCVYELPEGVYSVTVIDANGCEETEWFVIDPLPCSAGVAEVIPDEIWSGMGTTFHLINWSGSAIQWQFRTEFTTWLDVPNGTTSTFDTPPIYVASDKEIEVRALVICEDGNVLYSNVAVLTVYALEQFQSFVQPDPELFGVQTTSVNELDKEVNLSVYPSPTTGLVNLHSDDDHSNIEIIISDLNGRTISRSLYDQTISGQRIEMDLTGNTPGLYLVTFRSNTGMRTDRIVLK